MSLLIEYELIEWYWEGGLVYARVSSEYDSYELIGPYDTYEEMITDIGLDVIEGIV